MRKTSPSVGEPPTVSVVAALVELTVLTVPIAPALREIMAPELVAVMPAVESVESALRAVEIEPASVDMLVSPEVTVY